MTHTRNYVVNRTGLLDWSRSTVRYLDICFWGNSNLLPASFFGGLFMLFLRCIFMCVLCAFYALAHINSLANSDRQLTFQCNGRAGSSIRRALVKLPNRWHVK